MEFELKKRAKLSRKRMTYYILRVIFLRNKNIEAIYRMSIINKITGSILGVGVKFMDKRRQPLIDGEINLPGLEAKVFITRDKGGVPHIQAGSTHDLFFTQGFLHAQDRLWQMELNRRTASGRLSEIFGSIALDTDRTARTFGWGRIGKIDWENAGDELKEVVNAYIKGVNAHINSLETHTPVEFTLIKHKPDLWKVDDVMGVMRFMIWQLSHAWYGEIIRAKLIEAVGPEHAAELEIHYPKGNPNTISAGLEFNKYVKGVLKKAKDPLLKQSMGSNSWVISKERSATGSPILSNDMHLPMSLPALWYVNHLRSKDINVTGVSIPGLPMVLVGHNECISWGMTLAFTDAEDLYIERFDSSDPTKYEYKGKLLDAEVFRETINIKGELPHVETVLITKHGTVISDVVDIMNQERIAVNSKSLQPNNAYRGWFKLNKAKNWGDFTDAIRDIEAPQLNVTYADAENIGYWVSGRIPLRAKGHTGMVPVPGWDGKNDWKGEIAFEDMPHVFNPKSGLIISCNHKIIGDDYPHYLGNVWMNGYRAKRIGDYFGTLDKISVEDTKKMQLDFYSIPGLEFISHYKDILLKDHDPKVDMALELMKNWDGYLTADSVGGALYSVTRYMAVRHLFEPNLGRELTDTLMGTGFHPILLPSHEFFGHDTVTLLRMLSDPEASWWLTHAGGKDKLLRDSFNRAFEWLRKNIGLDINGWSWGKIHQIEFAHSMAIQKPMDVVFNRGPIPVGGDPDTPCQMSFNPNDPYMARSWVPSWRQIIDMGDLAKSEYMFAPGQSGQLTNRHYDDLIDKWISGEYNVMGWTRGQIEKSSEGILTLNP